MLGHKDLDTLYRGVLGFVAEVTLWAFEVHDVIYDNLRTTLERKCVEVLVKGE